MAYSYALGHSSSDHFSFCRSRSGLWKTIVSGTWNWNTSICLGIQTNYGTNPDTVLHTGVVSPCWVTADNSIIELCMNSVYMHGLHITIGPKVCSSKIEPSSNEVVKPLQYGWLHILLIPMVNGRCHTHTAYTQGCSYQIWSGQVRSVRARTLHPRGVWGHVPPESFCYEIAAETILGAIWCFSEARQWSLTWMNVYPFCPLHHTLLVNICHEKFGPPPILSPWTKYLFPPDWIFQHWIWNIQSPGLKHLVPCIK